MIGQPHGEMSLLFPESQLYFYLSYNKKSPDLFRTQCINVFLLQGPLCFRIEVKEVIVIKKICFH